MELTTGGLTPVLEQLRAAADVAAVLAVVRNESAVSQLGMHPKDPAVRRAVMLLASASQHSREDLARRAGALATLWSVKSLRPLVEEFTPRTLSEPIPVVDHILSVPELRAVSAWLSPRKYTWISDYASASTLVSSDDAPTCFLFVTLLLQRSDLASALERLASAIDARREAEPALSPHRVATICSSVASALTKIAPPLGQGVGNTFHRLANSHLLTSEIHASAPERANVGLQVAQLATVLIERSPSLLLSSDMLQVFVTIGTDWLDQREKQWVRLRDRLFQQVRHVVEIMAVTGRTTEELTQRARPLEPQDKTIERLCRAIAEDNQPLREEVNSWLRGGGKETPPSKTPDTPASRSGLDAIALAVLRAEELKQAIGSGPMLESRGQIEALLSEIQQLALRNGLEIDGHSGELVPYDPLRQRLARPLGRAAKVRVLVPGVIRQVGGNRSQLVQALVEPESVEPPASSHAGSK